MSWKDEKITDYDTKFKGLKETAAQHILHAVAIEWVSTALQEAYDKGASIVDLDLYDKAKAQGAQEALAKVEEWVNENFGENDSYPPTQLVVKDDLLHYLQQLKDNKTS